MAHFFKYANRVMHAGTNEAKERDERNDRLRQSGLKAGNGKFSLERSNEVKERRLQDLAQQKRFREIAKNKGSAITKALNKNK